MVDQKLISGIFNDFLALYLGKKQIGIRPLCEKYENHPMLMGLLSNMDEAAKIPVPKVMKETYDLYKEYRGRELEDEECEQFVDRTYEIYDKWDKNKWCGRIIAELVCLIDSDATERRKLAREVEKEMEEAMRQSEEKDAA